MKFNFLMRLGGFFYNPWLTFDQLRAIQNQKLAKIVSYAYENIVYYHRLFKSQGIVPADIQSVDDLSKIPITYKAQLRYQNGEEFLSPARRCRTITMTTSGGTGFPLAARLTQGEYRYWKLLLLRALLDGGAKLTDNFVVLAHPLRFPRHKPWFQYLGILRHHYVSALQSPAEFTAQIIKSRPDVILGYGGALKLLLLELSQKPKIELTPRLIISSAERLDPQTRLLAKKLLKVEITDLYSAVETGPAACECAWHQGYHVYMDTVIIECIDSRGRPQVGQPGRIVCTNLFNFTMPFIRYCIDDIGTLTLRRCNCGRGGMLLESLEGKTTDFLIFKDKVISPVTTETILKKYVFKARYRLIQHDFRTFDLELLPGRDFDLAGLPDIAHGIREDLGYSDLNINIRLVDAQLFNQEKFRTVVSHVRGQAAG